MKTVNDSLYLKSAIIFLIYFCSIYSGISQEYRNASDFDQAEPLSGLSDIRSSKEIYLLWGQDELFKNQIVDYFPTAQADISLLESTISDVFAPYRIDQGEDINETTRVAAAAVDLEGDGRDDVVRATTTLTGELLLSVTEVLSDLQVSGNSINLTIMTNVAMNARLNVYILAGNFDSDIGQELVVVWPEAVDNTTNEIQIRVYDWKNGGLMEIAKYRYANTVKEFDVVLTDMDLDGVNELALAALRPGSPLPEISTSLLGFTDSKLMVLTNHVVNAFDEQTPFTEDVSLALSKGDYDGDVAHELALIFRQKRNNSSTQRLQLRLFQSVDVSDNSSESVFEKLRIANANRSLIEYSIENIPEYQKIYTASGDVDGDGDDDLAVYSPTRDLLIFTTLDSLEITQVNDFTDFLKGATLKPIFCFTRGGSQSLGIQMADLDRDGIEELVYAGLAGCTDDIFSDNMTGANMTIEVYDMRTGTPRLAGVSTIEKSNTSFLGRVPANFILGDFDGDNLRLGRGRYYRKSEISQPLIILNAPPIHFDHLKGKSYDVNGCYQKSDCSFSSTYFTSSTASMETSTTVSSAWGVSLNVRASGSADAVVVRSEINASVTARYGERFSRYRSSGKRLEISTQVSAIEDDQIFAMVTDYDIWEYPVYEKDSLLTHLVSIAPAVIERRWFPSKSYNAYDYLPDHEVGNILSYREQKPDLTRVAQLINSEKFTLSENSKNKWTVNKQSFTESGSSRFREFGIGASLDIETEAQFKVFGGSVGATLTAEYETSDLTTQRTSISDEIEIEVDLGGVDESLGEVKYAVNPYCYWAKNGALIVDYTAQPEVPAPGAPDTWWSFNYGKKADPALILPWRYDPEKGLTLQDEKVKRFQSKSIGFSNDKPMPGDTITIYVEVHNWSLLPTEQPVEVGLYLCDPGQEANRLTGVHGETTITTIQELEPRGSDIVSFEWKVPDDLPAFPRIYAYIDPNNREDEIHENNNYGFLILNIPTKNEACPPPTILTNNAGNSSENGGAVKLYPNPATSILTVSFDSPIPGEYTLDIINPLGQVIYRHSGRSQLSGPQLISQDVSTLSSGLYFYRLRSHGRIFSGKLLMK